MIKMDSIYAYYCKRREKIRALEEQIASMEKDDWGMPSTSRQCQIATLKKKLNQLREID